MAPCDARMLEATLSDFGAEFSQAAKMESVDRVFARGSCEIDRVVHGV